MKDFYINIIKPILLNEIVINWIAPIITGLLVIAIPTAIIKFFRLRKDIKKINNVNKRFIDSIRPYIIEKIEISSQLITDIRKAIIMDSDIKERFVISELDLRNKLIMDINESKYIDEINKKELIDFTYNTFQSFVNEGNELEKLKNNENEIKTKYKVSLLKTPIILIIVSQIMIIVTLYFDKSSVKFEDNFALFFPVVLGMISIINFTIDLVSKYFKSGISENKKLYNNYENMVYTLILNTMFNKNEKKEKENKNKK